MGYNLFLDDLRDVDSRDCVTTTCGYDFVVARSSAEATALLTQYGVPDRLALDHDLGDDDTALVYLRVLADTLLLCPATPTPEYTIHSANPVGRNNIHAFMTSLHRVRGV